MTSAAVAALFFALPALSLAQVTPSNASAPPAISPQATATPILPEGTPITVVMENDLSTATSNVGEHFDVTVVGDVITSGIVVIPKGTTGYGEVTFVSRNRTWGAPGILGITLRALTLDGKSILLDGHYREEGKSADGAAAATMFAAGIFAALVKGKVGIIPKGRVLRARTGQDVAYTVPPPTPNEATALPGPEAGKLQPAATESKTN